MVFGTLGDTILEITTKMGLLSVLIPEISNHLSKLHKAVVEAEQISKVQNEDLRAWLVQVNDSVNDLKDLVEEYLYNEDSKLFRNLSLKNKIKDVAKKLEGLADNYNKVQNPTSEGGAGKESEMSNHYEVYNKLSLHKKRCFAYCLLFPEGYEFDVPQLIKLWMAEGFLEVEHQNPKDQAQDHKSHDQSQDKGGKAEKRYDDQGGNSEETGQDKGPEPEDLGQRYVREFLDKGKSIFQDVKEDECGRIRSCKMSTQMRALATLMGLEESILMDADGHGVRDGLRRVSLDYSLDLSCGIPISLFVTAKKLGTILLPAITQSRFPNEVKMSNSTCEALFAHFKSLSVLDLHNLGIKVVPTSIGDLKHLKYLDLSENDIEKLPSSITKLFNLQTLKLSRCHILRELPKDLGDLKNLRHLETEGCLGLTHMPAGIKKLTSLQTLSHFVAGNSHTGRLEELSSLNKLTGDLEILHLEQLKPRASEKKQFYLKEKTGLQGLTLRWDHDNDDKNKARQSCEDAEKLFDRLEPHGKLKVVFIVGYQGKLSQSWLSPLKSLVRFSLYNCPNCEYIPSMHELNQLKILKLERLDSLQYIDGESSSPQGLIETLEELTLSDCPNLTSWWKLNEVKAKFLSISKLEVQYCPKLTNMPLYPDLDEKLVLVCSSGKPLEKTINWKKEEGTSTEQIPLSKLKSVLIANVEEESLEVWIKNFTSLEYFHIRECPLKSFPIGLNHLKSITIENCAQLDLPSDAWKGLKSLSSLTLRGIQKMTSFPSNLGDLTSLKTLELHSCHALTYLPDSISNLRSLHKFVISECDKLSSLPLGLTNLSSLETLIIKDSSLLLPRSQRETGDDWPKISHIKKILLTQTSQDQ